MREFWFENSGKPLYAVEDGAGRPIIMLHGGLADHRACLPMVSPLSARFRVITPDLRASGRSRDPRPLDWAQLAKDVGALMDHLGLRKAVVGGVSGGTGAAVRFALDHPERVAGLVVVMPVYAGADQGLTEQQAAAFAMMERIGSRAPAEGVQVLRELFAGLPPEIREGAFAMLNDFDAGSVAATARLLGSGAQPFDSVSELRALDVPTLLIPGNDPLHPTEVAERYFAHLTRCSREANAVNPAPAIGEFCERDACW